MAEERRTAAGQSHISGSCEAGPGSESSPEVGEVLPDGGLGQRGPGYQSFYFGCKASEQMTALSFLFRLQH